MPHYTAISYTWGSAVRDESIILDGSLRNVTRSAHEVLVRVRLQSKPILIWIDSICINQDDTKEKSKQIQLMGQIYSMASNTVGWIGQSAEDSDLAIKSIKSHGEVFGSGNPCEPSSVFGEYIRDHARSEAGSQEWIAIEKILARSWFHRIWVLQEVALSKRLIIYCGDNEFLWDDILRFIIAIGQVDQISRPQLGLGNTLSPVKTMMHLRLMCRPEDYLENPKTHASAPLLQDLNPILRYIAMKYVIRSNRMKKLSASSRGLITLLKSCAHFGATDPRDQVYGLLGIAGDSGEPYFLPDYSQSVRDVYINVTRHIITKTMSLEVLQSAGVGMVERRVDLPSWVPDFASLSYGPTTQDYEVNFRAGIFPFAGPPGIFHRIFGNSISFQGAVIDEIDRLGSEIFHIDSHWYQWFTEARELAAATYPANTMPPDGLWRTLMANHANNPGSHEYPAPLEYRTAFTSFLRIYLDPKFAELSLEQASVRVENDPSIPAQDKQQAALFLDQSCLRINTRRFATTSRNHIALVHPRAQVRDQICVLLGAKVPFVIRQSLNSSGNDTFELVGECYVDGLMEGQGLQFANIQFITLV